MTKPPRPRPEPSARAAGPGRLRTAASRLGSFFAWWEEQTGKESLNDDARGLREMGRGLVGAALLFAFVYPVFRPRTVGQMPRELRLLIAIGMGVAGVGCFLAYAARYPLRALRSLLEMMVILAAVFAIGFFLIKPAMMGNP